MTMGIIYFPFRMLGRADTEWPRGEKPPLFFSARDLDVTRLKRVLTNFARYGII
jgi:hypothetical protein